MINPKWEGTNFWEIALLRKEKVKETIRARIDKEKKMQAERHGKGNTGIRSDNWIKNALALLKQMNEALFDKWNEVIKPNGRILINRKQHYRRRENPSYAGFELKDILSGGKRKEDNTPQHRRENWYQPFCLRAVQLYLKITEFKVQKGRYLCKNHKRLANSWLSQRGVMKSTWRSLVEKYASSYRE